MTDLLLIIIIALLAYLIYVLRGKAGEKAAAGEKFSYAKILPDYLNKTCEITIKEPLAAIDIMFTVKGTLVDLDEEWVMLQVEGKKTSSAKMIRIDNISSVKEIRE